MARKNRTDAIKRAAEYQGSSTIMRGAKRAPHQHDLTVIKGRQRCTTCPHVEPRPKQAAQVKFPAIDSGAITAALGAFDKVTQDINKGFGDLVKNLKLKSKSPLPQELSDRTLFKERLPRRDRDVAYTAPDVFGEVPSEALTTIVDKLNEDGPLVQSEPTLADIEMAVPHVVAVVQMTDPTEEETRAKLILGFTNQPDAAMREELVQTVQWLNLHGFDFKLNSKTNKAQLWAWIREARSTVQDANVPEED